MPVLLALGRFARPVRRVPGLGWLVSDPATVRRILNDPDHFTTIGEGVVGHLWARVLGDGVYDMLDGRGHRALRTKTRTLFTEQWAAALVSRAAGPRLRRCTADLAAGGAVDVADLARIVVGRVVADLLGLTVGMPEATSGDADDAYRKVFDTGTQLATLAFGSTGSTHVPRVPSPPPVRSSPG